MPWTGGAAIALPSPDRCGGRGRDDRSGEQDRDPGEGHRHHQERGREPPQGVDAGADHRPEHEAAGLGAGVAAEEMAGPLRRGPHERGTRRGQERSRRQAREQAGERELPQLGGEGEHHHGQHREHRTDHQQPAGVAPVGVGGEHELTADRTYEVHRRDHAEAPGGQVVSLLEVGEQGEDHPATRRHEERADEERPQHRPAAGHRSGRGGLLGHPPTLRHPPPTPVARFGPGAAGRAAARAAPPGRRHEPRPRTIVP